MHKSLGILLAALLATPVYAADSYTIDPDHTWPMFGVNHLGFSTQRGRFNKSSGKVTLDVAAKKAASNWSSRPPRSTWASTSGTST